MKGIYRIISVLLCAMIIITAFPSSALATNDNQLQEQTNEEIVIGSPSGNTTDSLNPDALKVKQKGDMTLNELCEIDITKVEYPKCISREKALSRGHVNRLNKQEKNLNTVVYQNRDGSKTAYIFSKPVKYIDSNGNIKDKDTTLINIEHEIYTYAMENNSVKAYFPENIMSGSLIKYNNYCLKMTPVYQGASNSSSRASFASVSGDTITYQNVFGTKADLRYTMLLSGVKEDIVIREYDGQSQFRFILEADGLTAQLGSDGYWRLINNNVTVFKFEKIVVNDSNGKTIFGTMNIGLDESGNRIMTVSVPQSFLQDPTTEYPVFVDPTATIWETSVEYDPDIGEESTMTTIIDVGLFASEEDYQQSEGALILNVGTSENDVCKIIYQFPDFYDSVRGAYTWMNQYNIGSATLNLNFITASGVTVNANPMTAT